MNHEQLLNYLVDEMTRYAKECNWVTNNWRCEVDYDLSFLSKVSHGGLREGSPYIMISLYPTLGERFYEYASFANDKCIGSFCGPTSRCVAALVAHEFAHAVCCCIKPNAKKVIAKNQTLNHEDVYGHGLLWREIYRMLRKHFVNDKVYDLDENSIIVQSQENVKDYIDNHRKIGISDNLIAELLIVMGYRDINLKELLLL